MMKLPAARAAVTAICSRGCMPLESYQRDYSVSGPASAKIPGHAAADVVVRFAVEAEADFGDQVDVARQRVADALHGVVPLVPAVGGEAAVGRHGGIAVVDVVE